MSLLLFLLCDEEVAASRDHEAVFKRVDDNSRCAVNNSQSKTAWNIISLSHWIVSELGLGPVTPVTVVHHFFHDAF